MFHSNTETMVGHWRDLAQDGRTPGRRALDPGRFPRLAPQTLILGRVGPGEFRVRLAGAQVMKIHRRATMTGRDGLSGWAQDDRMTLRVAFEAARRHCEPVVATVDALWGPASCQIEMLFAPLAGDDGGPDRLLGHCQPLGPLPSASNLPSPQFVLRSLERLEPLTGFSPHLRLAALEGRTVAGG